MQSCLSNKADTALTLCTTSIISFKQALSKRGEVWSPYTSVQLNIADANSQVLFLGTRGCCLVYWKEENDWLQVYYLMKATVAMTTPWLLSKHGSCTIASMAIVNAYGSGLSLYFRCWFYCYFIPVFHSDVPDSPCVCPSLAGGYFSQKTWHNVCHHINNDFSKKPSLTS